MIKIKKKKKLRKLLRKSYWVISDLLWDYENERNYHGAQSVANADDFLKKLDGEK